MATKRHWITLAALTLITLCSGCAEIASMRSAVAKYGADASDQTLETAIWTMCQGSSVGAIKRRFKTEAEQEAYEALCP